MRVRWTRLALQRVSEIAGRIAQDHPEAARHWVEGLFDAIGRLERFPGHGRRVPEVDRPSIREILFGEYRVIYKIEARRIGILTVRHGRRRFDTRELRRR